MDKLGFAAGYDDDYDYGRHRRDSTYSTLKFGDFKPNEEGCAPQPCYAAASQLTLILNAVEDCPNSRYNNEPGVFNVGRTDFCTCPQDDQVDIVPFQSGCGIAKAANCSGSGTLKLWNGKCVCPGGIKGDRCESGTVTDGEAKSNVAFYASSGVVCAGVIVVSLFVVENPATAIWIALRSFDMMSDWGMWAIALKSEAFTKYSTVGSEPPLDCGPMIDGCDMDSFKTAMEEAGGISSNPEPVYGYKIVQTVALVFTILGTLLFIVELGSIISGDSMSSRGKLGIALVEDLPQLVITILFLAWTGSMTKFGAVVLDDGGYMSGTEYHVSLFGIDGKDDLTHLDSGDVVAVVSLVLTIISLLGNCCCGVGACVDSDVTFA